MLNNMTNISFSKRLLVIVYDGLLVLGVTLVGYALVFTFFTMTPVGFESTIAGKSIKAIYLVVASFSFYAWFWVNGGQTLGMKAWNFYLVDRKGKFVSWEIAALRYLIAIISWGGIPLLLYYLGVERWYLSVGLGFSWSLLDKHNLAWHDIITGTQIIYLPKNKRPLDNPTN